MTEGEPEYQQYPPSESPNQRLNRHSEKIFKVIVAPPFPDLAEIVEDDPNMQRALGDAFYIFALAREVVLHYLPSTDSLRVFPAPKQ